MCSFPASFLLDNLGITTQKPEGEKMALYESVIIGRQDLTPGQFETLLEKFIAVIQSFKGEIKKERIGALEILLTKSIKTERALYAFKY